MGEAAEQVVCSAKVRTKTRRCRVRVSDSVLPCASEYVIVKLAVEDVAPDEHERPVWLECA